MIQLAGPKRRISMWLGALTIWIVALLPVFAGASELADTVARVKGSVVGIGTHQPTGRPPSRLLGTGFVVGNGLQVITNAHVLPASLDTERFETLVVFIGSGESPTARPVEIRTVDRDHDVALLGIKGQALPALQLGDSERVREGELYAFTGFPIGAVLGLYPATHQGLIASITPVAIPQVSLRGLDVNMLRRLQDPYEVFQLDATAYPGSSGSPLYHPKTGRVVGVINKVFVQGTKESALERPSGITYAIPVRHVRQLLEVDSP
ncbi:MAG: serine protease [Pseudomonadota bacterium]|nr:serine protease [Pseudomonadota bacterium]